MYLFTDPNEDLESIGGGPEADADNATPQILENPRLVQLQVTTMSILQLLCIYRKS